MQRKNYFPIVKYLNMAVPLNISSLITEQDKSPAGIQKAEPQSIVTQGNINVTGIVVGAVCGVSVLICLVLIGCRIYRHTCRHFSDYEKLAEQKMTILRGLQSDTGKIPPPVAKAKEIPFTLPPSSTPPLYKRSDSRISTAEDGSTGSGSEPASPMMSKGSSMEFPGAYSLGAINPELYKIPDEDDDVDYPEGHIGRIWFAMEYERESEKLIVTLIKAKNLPSRFLGNVNGCDPFIRLFLMPDERRYLQSKLRRKTCNPKFDESFVFQVSVRALEERVLKLSAFDVDRHRKHNVIGHILYPLKDLDVTENGKIVMWRDLVKEVAESTSDIGELLISLCYNNHLDRLTVVIFEGKNFRKLDGCTHVDSYVKVCLMQQNKPIKTKRTSIIKKSVDPVFNESFSFKLLGAALDTASVNITTFQHMPSHKADRQIGRVILGAFMFARGKELEHWNEMLSNPREQIQQWHSFTA